MRHAALYRQINGLGPSDRPRTICQVRRYLDILLDGLGEHRSHSIVGAAVSPRAGKQMPFVPRLADPTEFHLQMTLFLELQTEQIRVF